MDKNINIDLIGVKEIFNNNDQNNYGKAKNVLENLIKKKNRYAIHLMGELREKGLGYEKSIEQAKNYYSLGSFLGNENSSFNLALLYFKDKDYFIAKRYFLKCQGIGLSFFYLGLIEEKGLVGNISLHRAFENYFSGAQLHDKYCLLKTSNFLENGLGIKKNSEKAEYFKALQRKYYPNENEAENPLFSL